MNYIYKIKLTASQELWTKISLSRQSVVRALTEDGTKHLPVHMPEKIKKMSIAGVPPLIRQNTMGDLEMIDLAPKVEGRIRKLDAQVSRKHIIRKSQKRTLKISFYFNVQQKLNNMLKNS